MKTKWKEKEIVTKFSYEFEAIENIWIPMSDGTRLAARLWMPKCEKKVPAILEYIPYRKLLFFLRISSSKPY